MKWQVFSGSCVNRRLFVEKHWQREPCFVVSHHCDTSVCMCVCVCVYPFTRLSGWVCRMCSTATTERWRSWWDLRSAFIHLTQFLKPSLASKGNSDMTVGVTRDKADWLPVVAVWDERQRDRGLCSHHQQPSVWALLSGAGGHHRQAQPHQPHTPGMISPCQLGIFRKGSSFKQCNPVTLHRRQSIVTLQCTIEMWKTSSFLQSTIQSFVCYFLSFFLESWGDVWVWNRWVSVTRQ